jgi:hypothetical protein
MAETLSQKFLKAQANIRNFFNEDEPHIKFDGTPFDKTHQQHFWHKPHLLCYGAALLTSGYGFFYNGINWTDFMMPISCSVIPILDYHFGNENNMNRIFPEKIINTQRQAKDLNKDLSYFIKSQINQDKVASTLILGLLGMEGVLMCVDLIRGDIPSALNWVDSIFYFTAQSMPILSTEMRYRNILEGNYSVVDKDTVKRTEKESAKVGAGAYNPT